jgi:hypothetical protein
MHIYELIYILAHMMLFYEDLDEHTVTQTPINVTSGPTPSFVVLTP